MLVFVCVPCAGFERNLNLDLGGCVDQTNKTGGVPEEPPAVPLRPSGRDGRRDRQLHADRRRKAGGPGRQRAHHMGLSLSGPNVGVLK